MLSRWFLCLYINALPPEAVFRLWDCVLCGGASALFEVALGVILMSRSVRMSVRACVSRCVMRVIRLGIVGSTGQCVGSGGAQ
jgi:hypothetical protein